MVDLLDSYVFSDCNNICNNKEMGLINLISLVTSLLNRKGGHVGTGVSAVYRVDTVATCEVVKDSFRGITADMQGDS